MKAWLSAGPMAWLDAHLPVLVVLLPLAFAVALLLAGDAGGRGGLGAHDSQALRRQRRLAWSALLLTLAVVLRLFWRSADGDILVYRLGAWDAPYGIALVVDRLSAFMLLLTQAVAWPVLLYATGGWDAHGRHFHPLLQLQLMGLNGAFVTGDLFNLFVFFEVLLIASYVLMLHGSGAERLRAGLAYVAMNLAGSALFLFGLGLIYAACGSMNLADIARILPTLAPAEAALAQAGAMLLLVVFGFKAALLPMAMWLPATYQAAAAPVAALFAIMTKVGVYALWRVHGVAFAPGGEVAGGAGLAQGLLLPVALATSLVGALGALAAHHFARLVAWLTVSSVGTLAAALALGVPAAWAAALYYLANSTLVVAGLFMLAELVAAQRSAGDKLQPSQRLAQPTLLGLTMLLAAASAAGLPPLPGFIGKLALMQAALPLSAAPWVWATVLAVGWLTLLALARAGAIMFWNVREEAGGGTAAGAGAGAGAGADAGAGAGARASASASGNDASASASAAASPAPAAGPAPRRLVAATLAPLAASVALSLGAGPWMAHATATAEQLRNTAAYAHAVLGAAVAEGRAGTTRPYRGAPAPGPASAPGSVERRP